MTKTACGRLRPFRLAQIPLEIRLRAAKRASVRAIPDDAEDPRDRLFAALAAPAIDDDRVRLLRAAHAPSDRVYWVTEKAWAKVMGA